MKDVQNFFDEPVKNNSRTYDINQNFATGQRDDYETGCVLDSNYFKNYYKMIAIEAIQQVNFIGCLQTTAILFFIIEEANKKRF